MCSDVIIGAQFKVNLEDSLCSSMHKAHSLILSLSLLCIQVESSPQHI